MCGGFVLRVVGNFYFCFRPKYKSLRCGPLATRKHCGPMVSRLPGRVEEAPKRGELKGT